MTKIIARLAFGAGLLLPSAHALACGTYTEEMRWRYSDVIADGWLICPQLRSPCAIRATRVLKPISVGPLGRRTFRVEVDFEARERFDRENLVSCGGFPWEPTSERTRGRFYLSRDRGEGLFLNGRRASARRSE